MGCEQFAKKKPKKAEKRERDDLRVEPVFTSWSCRVTIYSPKFFSSFFHDAHPRFA
jgi:hypothetical protein